MNAARLKSLANLSLIVVSAIASACGGPTTPDAGSPVSDGGGFSFGGAGESDAGDDGGPDDGGPDDGGLDDDGGAADGGDIDAGAVDVDGYHHVDPPSTAVPEILRGETWRTHYVEDIAPYWTMTSAVGSPEGNFPTWRGMDGSVQGPDTRRPRMLSRQTYAYAVGYLLTGDVRLLELAHAGTRWILDHAVDEDNGGCHGLLNSDGSPSGAEPKTTQDLAYCMLGPAAYFFVTRDAEVEAALLDMRDLFFDGPFFDEERGMLLDGRTADLASAFDMEGDGGRELVAQLDVLNAFMLLVQPVLSDVIRREQFLDDMQAIGDVLMNHFWSDGIFWGVDTNIGAYQTRHVDFGHTLKSYWMLLEIDKRLAAHPYRDFLEGNAHAWVERAYGDGRWGRRPLDASTDEYGSDWWIYAEAEQLAATLNLLDYRYIDELTLAAANWIGDFVDDAYGELIPGINADGSPVWGWTASDTAKCNEWKNGYHSAEHALVFYLLGRNLEGLPATLHFAVPSTQAFSFAARPYLFHGQELARSVSSPIDVGGGSLTPVAVSFDGLY